MARYYTSLPSVSTSLYAAIHKSPKFSDIIRDEPCSVLASAKIFRNELLYHDALILSLGPWSAPSYLTIKDPELLQIAKLAHLTVSAKLEKAHREILGVLVEHKDWGGASQQMDDVASANSFCSTDTIARETTCFVRMPAYYRECYKLIFSLPACGNGIRKAIAPLLKNDLTLGHSESAGVGSFRDFFLCLDAADVPLPWDKNEEEWYS